MRLSHSLDEIHMVATTSPNKIVIEQPGQTNLLIHWPEGSEQPFEVEGLPRRISRAMMLLATGLLRPFFQIYLYICDAFCLFPIFFDLSFHSFFSPLLVSALRHVCEVRARAPVRELLARPSSQRDPNAKQNRKKRNEVDIFESEPEPNLLRSLVRIATHWKAVETVRQTMIHASRECRKRFGRSSSMFVDAVGPLKPDCSAYTVSKTTRSDDGSVSETEAIQIELYGGDVEIVGLTTASQRPANGFISDQNGFTSDQKGRLGDRATSDKSIDLTAEDEGRAATGLPGCGRMKHPLEGKRLACKNVTHLGQMLRSLYA